MSSVNHLDELIRVIDDAVRGINEALPSFEAQIVRELELLLRELDLGADGSVKPTAKNLRVVGAMKAKMERIIMSGEYTASVDSFLDSYADISQLQAKYFQTLEAAWKPTPLLKELQTQSLDAATQALLRGGISVNVVDPVMGILRTNVTTGVQYTELIEQLRTYIQGNAESVGHLERYVKQITTDSLNQYAAQYNELVSSDLDLHWFRYRGHRTLTSRSFCIAMVNKQWYHRKELYDLIHGDFEQFRAVKGKIYQVTGLPDGMVSGTNPENFFVYRGGYNCPHQPIGISEINVPKNERIRVYKKYGIPYDKNGIATK
jgi:hypothetical protein